jgi:hypothetical protein
MQSSSHLDDLGDDAFERATDQATASVTQEQLTQGHLIDKRIFWIRVDGTVPFLVERCEKIK